MSGCGSKLLIRTFRGTELGEMLTSTCPNSGCGKSVSRQDMLQYIENSGGQDYPFYTEGRVVRLATTQDLEAQDRLEQSKHALRLDARQLVEKLIAQGGHENLRKIKVVEVEPVLGGESVTIYIMSEERIEFRDLSREFQRIFHTRVEVRGVGARDEARLTADYEKCGQYCCCKNFLKVLKPVSMKSAKVQKATLDPLKISGRCGRLMCCLRYEDSTYEDLAKRLPRKKSRIGTPDGDGIVLDTQILTQLALVLLDTPGDDGKERQVAVPVESITPVVDPKGPSIPLIDRLRNSGPPPASPAPKRPGAPSPAAAAQTRSEDTRNEPDPLDASRQPPPPPRPPQQQQQQRGDRPQQQRPPQQGQPRRDQPQQGQRGQQDRGPQRPAQRPRTREEEIDELMGGGIIDDLGGARPRAPRPPQGPRPPRDGRGPQRPDQGRPGPGRPEQNPPG